jgi:hypothetical protein
MLYLHSHHACATTNLAQLNSTRFSFRLASRIDFRPSCLSVLPSRAPDFESDYSTAIHPIVNRWSMHLERWIDDDFQNGSAIAGTAASNNNLQHFVSSW